jgi:Family of unknown function (DUF5706)
MWGKRADLSHDLSSGDVRVEFAWNAYWAQENWSRNVDTKASIVLALETAVLGGGLGTLTGSMPFMKADEWRRALAFSGLGLLLLAVLAAGLTIVPHIRRDPVRRHDPSEMRILWFGHLRQFDAADIRTHLCALSPDRCVEILARDLRKMSSLNWMKCIRLRVSMTFAFLGAVVVTIAVWPIVFPVLRP